MLHMGDSDLSVLEVFVVEPFDEKKFSGLSIKWAVGASFYEGTRF